MNAQLVTPIDYFAVRAIHEEAKRRLAYNDKTGKVVTCKTLDPETSGNLSIGIGVNLEIGLDDEEIEWLFRHRAAKVDKALTAYAWYGAMDAPRASVFLDLGFNNGVVGLLHYTETIHYAALKEWGNCSNALLASKAAQKDPHRYNPLANIIKTGVV